jgi:hypothetical protein
MTVLALRYPPRDRGPKVPDSTSSRFGREVRGARVSTIMSDSGMTKKMEEIQARLLRDAYAVDAAKVADAIVERLLAGRSAKEPERR